MLYLPAQLNRKNEYCGIVKIDHVIFVNKVTQSDVGHLVRHSF